MAANDVDNFDYRRIAETTAYVICSRISLGALPPMPDIADEAAKEWIEKAGEAVIQWRKEVMGK